MHLTLFETQDRFPHVDTHLTQFIKNYGLLQDNLNSYKHKYLVGIVSI